MERADGEGPLGDLKQNAPWLGPGNPVDNEEFWGRG